MTENRATLLDDLSTLIDRHACWLDTAPAQAPWPASLVSAELFDALALRVACFQLEHNQAYGRYVSQLVPGLTASTITSAYDAPPAPTDAFRVATLTTFDPQNAVRLFRSSGTTAHARGRHYLRTLTLARASSLAPFAAWMLPRFAGRPEARMRMLVFAPSAEDSPDSSLCFMLDDLRQRFGDSESAHFVHHAGGLDLAAAREALRRASSQGVPVFLLGPSFVYVHLIDGLAGEVIPCAVGSQVFETGGFKGRSRAVAREELHAMLAAAFAIPSSAIAGEYGMSELSSQLYETHLRAAAAGPRAAGRLPDVDTLRVYVPPPWCAVRVVDPVSLAPLPIGEVGQVAFFDLANLDSVAHVVSGDRGRLVCAEEVGMSTAPEGWHGLPAGAVGLALHGRAPDATPKGCSIAIDALVSGEDEDLWM